MATTLSSLELPPAQLAFEHAVMETIANGVRRWTGWWLQLPGDSPWPVVLLAIICFYGVDIASRTVSSAVSSTYRQLSPERQASWNNRTVSALHALVVSVGAVRVLRHDPALRLSFVYSHSTAATFYLAIFLGYILFDLVFMLQQLKRPGEQSSTMRSMFFHHLLAICSVAVPLLTQRYAMLSLACLLSEFSTPFLNLRYLLEDLELGKHHWLSLANQLAFMVTFFFCRVIVHTWVAKEIVSLTFLADTALFNSPHLLTRVEGLLGSLFAMALLVLNVYWFLYIAKRALKTYRQVGRGVPAVKKTA